MTDRRHNDTNATVRAIVDDAIAELLMLGMHGRDDAAYLMAMQAIVRVDDPEKVKRIARFATDLCEGGE